MNSRGGGGEIDTPLGLVVPTNTGFIPPPLFQFYLAEIDAKNIFWQQIILPYELSENFETNF